jgi:dipeptidyl aminopeptidase/acylaminoacyl peptidase
MQVVPLISRETFFNNPDYTMVRLSPDGRHLSYIAPDQGVLNIWVGEVTDLDSMKPITFDRKRGIRHYAWAYTNHHILYTQDQDGDENWHIYCIDLRSGNIQDLTPFPNIHARLEQMSRFYPQDIIVAINKRRPEFHDLYRVNIDTGVLTQLYENDEFAGFLCDDQLLLRFAYKLRPDGGSDMLQKTDIGWQTFLKVDYEDVLTTHVLGFNKERTHLYMIDSRERNTAALAQLAITDQSWVLIAQNDKADIADVLLHPTDKTIEGAATTYERKQWQFFSAPLQKDLDYIRQKTGGDLELTSRTLTDDQWIVLSIRDDQPSQYYHFDRSTKKLTFLFSVRKALDNLPLCKMHPIVISARDGLNLVSYLTVPLQADPHQSGQPNVSLPLVLCVHGGPQARDGWGFDPIHQWLANRGYAVLSVNYRGSTGFGKSFINIADGQWSRTMHDDLIDAVQWVVEQGIADPKKIAIMGGSYGGYATLVGLTFTPDIFACGVDIVGPSNLATLLATVPEYWKPVLDILKKRLGGDLETEEGRRELEVRSPLFKYEQIKKPLLIAQGANDPRVKQAEADQIVQALKSKNIPVTYVLYPDEGHGFARPENRLSFYAITEAFLATHLGGQQEPIKNDFDGASLQILEGKEFIGTQREILEQFPGY